MVASLKDCSLYGKSKRDWVSESVTRSPIELFWTAKKSIRLLRSKNWFCIKWGLHFINAATNLCSMRQNYALSMTVEHFRFNSHMYKILNLIIVHQNFLVLKDLSALVLIFIILKLVSNWIWAPRWAVCGAEWFGWAFIGCRCCIKYDRAPPSLLTLINSTVWSLYSPLTWLADLLFGIWTSNNMVLKSCFGKSTFHMIMTFVK